MPDYGVSGEKKGDIWHENSRKPVFGFRLLGGEGEEGNFAKVSAFEMRGRRVFDLNQYPKSLRRVGKDRFGYILGA